jgi:hypothetical protein
VSQRIERNSPLPLRSIVAQKVSNNSVAKLVNGDCDNESEYDEH